MLNKKSDNKLFWLISSFTFIVLYGSILVNNIFEHINLNDKVDTFYNISKEVFIGAVFIAPILEEFIFRNHLSYKKEHFYGILLIILVYALFYYHLGSYFLLTMFLLFFIIIFFYKKSQKILLLKFPRLTFWLTSITFCIFHFFYLSNYNFSVISKIGILLLHYLPLSLFLGTVRKNYGLIYSISFHSFYNILVLVENTFLFDILIL